MVREKNRASNREERKFFSYFFERKDMIKREGKFKTELIQELEFLFPGCLILKNDAGYLQGIPDLLILFKHTWAALETKRTLNSSRQPNQEYYIEELDSMSFASFICPENKQEVLYELQQAFNSRRTARFS